MSARVLVVDDVAANVKLLEARLSAEYFDVVTASNGAEALSVCARGECDIVLLDVMMPGLDGFEVDHNWCRSIYTMDPNGTMVEYCVTTGVFTQADRDRAIAALTTNDLPHSAPPKSLQHHKASDYRTAAE